MTERLEFLRAWLPMRRGLSNLRSDWHTWDIGWRTGSRGGLSRG